jgi:hypothetical protein
LLPKELPLGSIWEATSGLNDFPRWFGVTPAGNGRQRASYGLAVILTPGRLPLVNSTPARSRFAVSDMSSVTPHKGCLGERAGLVHRSLMAVAGRTSSRILFHMSSVGTTGHMSWGMSRRTVEGLRAGVQRHTNTKEGENSPLEQGSRPQ